MRVQSQIRHTTLLFLAMVLLLSCKDTAKSNEDHKFTNALINETSPYLLQHAHNPVDWRPWSEAALEEAREKVNRLLAEHKPMPLPAEVEAELLRIEGKAKSLG